MTSVFCKSAFGRLPSRIEVLSVLGGERVVFKPNEDTYKQSLDYMYLVKSMLPSAAPLNLDCTCAI
ncbi:hypothetical protein [Paenibacillus castaneae]|nr:hypothetical protein [Paenibacillus castaneae]